MNKIFSVIVVAIMIFTLRNSFHHEVKIENNIINESKIENEVVILNENVTKNTMNNNTVSNENNNTSINPLENKTIAFLGDSLVRGYGNDDNGFDYYLSLELKNTNFINNSKSGSTITSNSGEDNIIMINQAKSLIGNPDIIAFDGGANDIIGYSLGFLNNDLKKDIGFADGSEDSVITDLKNVIVELKSSYPNSKLCYIQPCLLDEETVSHLTR